MAGARRGAGPIRIRKAMAMAPRPPLAPPPAPSMGGGLPAGLAPPGLSRGPAAPVTPMARGGPKRRKAKGGAVFDKKEEKMEKAKGGKVVKAKGGRVQKAKGGRVKKAEGGYCGPAKASSTGGSFRGREAPPTRF